MQNNIATGISFSKELLKQVDKDRGDISRSRYITNILEEKYPLTKKIKRAGKRLKNNEENSNLNNSNKLDLLEIRPSGKSNFQ